MTESEYLIAGSLAKLRIARAAIADVLPFVAGPDSGLCEHEVRRTLNRIDWLIGKAEGAIGELNQENGRESGDACGDCGRSSRG